MLSLLGRPSSPLVQLSASSPFDDVFIVGAFGVGVILGLAVFSRVVAWLFERAQDITLSALTGLMIGALRLPEAKIAQGTQNYSDGLGSVLAAAIVGAIIVLILMRIDLKRNTDTATQAID